MVANLFNTVLGLMLVYSAVLDPSLTANRPSLLLVVAGLIFVAAWVARRTDHHPWQNNTNMVLAVLLAATPVTQLERLPLGMFWSQFSIGTVVAILALWAVLYRPAPSST